jgi:1-acyl-sn-glycerol-3-phosphate acyltransferase
MSRPDPMPRLARWRSNVLQAPPFFLATGIFGSLSLVASLFDRHGHLQYRIARLWARTCIFASGSRLRILGEENLRRHPVAVYAANHTSYMDTPVVFAAMPFQFRILAKMELWSMPFIGWHLNRSGQIPINTDNPRATLSSLAAAAKAVRNGMPLFVFPEGGRTTDGALQPFMNGAAYLAIRAQVPLVPIALHGVYDLMPIHTHHFHPGTLTFIAGEPIPTAGLTTHDADQLTAQLREAIQQLLAQVDPVTAALQSQAP